MKIKGQYVLRNIAGESVVVPVGSEQLDANVLVLLNETGAFLWELLYKGASVDEIVSAFCDEYDTDAETVKADLSAFVGYIKEKGIEIEA